MAAISVELGGWLGPAHEAHSITEITPSMNLKGECGVRFAVATARSHVGGGTTGTLLRKCDKCVKSLMSKNPDNTPKTSNSATPMADNVMKIPPMPKSAPKVPATAPSTEKDSKPSKGKGNKVADPEPKSVTYPVAVPGQLADYIIKHWADAPVSKFLTDAPRVKIGRGMSVRVELTDVQTSVLRRILDQLSVTDDKSVPFTVKSGAKRTHDKLSHIPVPPPSALKPETAKGATPNANKAQTGTTRAQVAKDVKSAKVVHPSTDKASTPSKPRQLIVRSAEDGNPLVIGPQNKAKGCYVMYQPDKADYLALCGKIIDAGKSGQRDKLCRKCAALITEEELYAETERIAAEVKAEREAKIREAEAAESAPVSAPVRKSNKAPSTAPDSGLTALINEWKSEAYQIAKRINQLGDRLNAHRDGSLPLSKSQHRNTRKAKRDAAVRLDRINATISALQAYDKL